MKTVKIYNSLTNKVEEFKPIEEGKVSIYYCGPTVYDYPHIGNCRPPVVFDLLRRVLLHIGYDVKFVSNFTDVDDKIINKAIAENKSEKEVSEHFIDVYKGILNDLNVLPATQNPKVTENMEEIIHYINHLVETDHAYVVGNDVFFRVNSVENYGQLANISLDDLKSGARIESDTNKENPFDFTLWKKTEKGITWNSPWGDGRPGWHTECCVMINNIFGNTIDIHGGGFDLKFPHHTNEIAQNHATCGKNLANYWMHNGFVVINNEKMSKSLGNVIKGNEFIDRIGPLLTRYILLATYYRAPLNISDDIIETSRIELNKITSLLNNLYRQIQLKHIEIDETKILSIDTFVDALCDDLNISNAMAEIFRIVKEANQSLRQREIDPEIIVKYFNTLNKMLDILGLKVDLIKLSEEDNNLINEFNKARAEKDFAKSDIIRAELIKKGLM